MARATVKEFGIDPDSEAGLFFMEHFESQLRLSKLEFRYVHIHDAQTLLDGQRHFLAEVEGLDREFEHPAFNHLGELIRASINRVIAAFGECPSPITHKFTHDRALFLELAALRTNKEKTNV
jgi:hypothetical protein